MVTKKRWCRGDGSKGWQDGGGKAGGGEKEVAEKR